MKRYLTLREEKLDRYPGVKERLEEVKRFLEEKLRDREFLQKIERSEDVSLTEREGQLYLVVGDAGAYIQASGRTSPQSLRFPKKTSLRLLPPVRYSVQIPRGGGS